MALLPQGEILRTPRQNALVPLIVGVVFIAIGVGVYHLAKAKSFDWFLYVWFTFWFIGSGAALVSGIHGLLKPPIYAILTEGGLSLPKWRVERIPWSHILDVRLAPKKQTDSEGTHYVFKEPLVLRLRDSAPLETTQAARWTQGLTARLPDGSVEWMIETQSCPLPANVFLARIQSRLLGEPVPVLPKIVEEDATFGGKPLNPPLSRYKSAMNQVSVWTCVLVGAALLLFGAKTWKRGHDALHWDRASATSTSAEVARDNDSWRVRVHYRFSHEGREYDGADFDARYRDGSRSYLEAKLGEYPAGRRLTVYYDPAQPEDSAFNAPGKHDSYIWLGVGAAFLGFGCISMRFSQWIEAIPRSR